MKRMVVVSAVAAFMALSASVASAADVTGVIKSINANAHEIVLEDGKTYSVPQTVNLSTFKAGDKVMVSMEVKDGKNVASKVEKAS